MSRLGIEPRTLGLKGGSWSRGTSGEQGARASHQARGLPGDARLSAASLAGEGDPHQQILGSSSP